MALSEPRSVLTRNVGNGNLEVQWLPPLSGVVDHYDIYVSTSQSSGYMKVNHIPFTGNVATIYNIPFGTRVYTKVCAVDANGVSGPFSEVADDAVCDRATIQLRFEGPVGDKIADNSLWAARCNGSLLGWALGSGGTLS